MKPIQFKQSCRNDNFTQPNQHQTITFVASGMHEIHIFWRMQSNYLHTVRPKKNDATDINQTPLPWQPTAETVTTARGPTTSHASSSRPSKSNDTSSSRISSGKDIEHHPGNIYDGNKSIIVSTGKSIALDASSSATSHGDNNCEYRMGELQKSDAFGGWVLLHSMIVFL